MRAYFVSRLWNVPGASLPIVLFAALVLAALSASCTKAEKEYGITLDSGVDRKTSSYDYAADEAPSGTTAGAEMAQVKDGAAQPDSVAQGLERTGGGSSAAELRLDIRRLRGRSLSKMPDISSVFLPSAYAAEHPIGDKYVIRTGTLDIQTAVVKDAISAITQTALKYGGGVTDSCITKDAQGYRSGYITLRVPSENFFEAWNELVVIDDVSGQQIKSEDRGQDYVTAVGQMNSLLAEQSALQKMYDEALAIHRSRGLREGYNTLLDTQRRLAQVNDQICTMESLLTQLADQIAFSTITVNLSEKPGNAATAPEDSGPFNWGLGATFNSAAHESMGSLRSVLQSLVYFAVSLRWVFWLALFLAARWAWKRWLRSQQPAPIASHNAPNAAGH